MIWPMNGAFGQNAGNITLTVGSFYSAPGKTNRFVARGGRGGDPDIGASGIDGISLPVPNNLGQPSQANNQEGLTASTYTDASLLSLKSAVEKLTVLPPQMAPQILGARGQRVAQHVADCRQGQADETIANKGKSRCLARRGVSCRKLRNGARCRFRTFIKQRIFREIQTVPRSEEHTS